VVQNSLDITSDTVLRAEIEFVRGFVMKKPANESPWSYLHGLFGDDCRQNPNHSHKRSVLDFVDILKPLLADVLETFTAADTIHAL
jgi:hypothetical protein